MSPMRRFDYRVSLRKMNATAMIELQRLTPVVLPQPGSDYRGVHCNALLALSKYSL